jgi:hypothetical protein
MIREQTSPASRSLRVMRRDAIKTVKKYTSDGTATASKTVARTDALLLTSIISLFESLRYGKERS